MAVKMQMEYGTRLNTIFVESQGHKMDQIQKLALKRKWLGSSAMWTTERPMPSGGRGLPAFVLLSPEGKVVMRGNPLAMHKQIEDYLGSLSRRARVKVPKALPRPLHGAFKNLAKGKIGAALSDAERVAARDTTDEGLKTAASELAAQARDRIDRELRRIDRAIDSGALLHAKEEINRLAKLVRGSSMEKAATERLDKLASDALKTEISAAKALDRVTRRLYSKGPTPASAKQLAAIARKYAGTKAAARATELAGLLDG